MLVSRVVTLIQKRFMETVESFCVPCCFSYQCVQPPLIAVGPRQQVPAASPWFGGTEKCPRVQLVAHCDWLKPLPLEMVLFGAALVADR